MTRPTVEYIEAPNGLGHALDTVQRMSALATRGSQALNVRRLATKITANVPSKDPPGELAAIYKWVRHRIRYRRDPIGLEWVQSPARTVKERAGDCDDLATLIAALAQALGHRTRFATVGKHADRPSHVYAEAWDGKAWIALDPVLEPRQATTAKRTDAGKFGHRAPGPKRIFDGTNGRQIGTMGETNGTRSSAIALWQPTAWERPSLARARVDAEYASKGAAHVTPIRLSTWINPYDPTDMAGLGSVGELGNIFKSIGKVVGSVAKIAAPIASMIPGVGTAIGAGLSVVGAGADALTKGGKKKKKKGKAIAGPQAAAAAEQQGAGPSGFGPAPNFAPAIRAMSKANTQGLQTIAALARTRIRLDAAASKDKRQKKAGRSAEKIRRSVARQLRRKTKGRSMHGFTPRMHFTLGAAEADPSTYDASTAAALAPKVAANIAAKKYDYSRALLKQFQSAAGITADGSYGGTSAGAIRYHTNGKTPPRPLFKPTTEQPYAPPSAAQETTRDDAPAQSTHAAEVAQTRREAPPPDAKPIKKGGPSARAKAQRAVNAARNFIAKRKRPPQVALPAVRAFQPTIKGLKVDGLWGWRTREAAAAVLGVRASTLPATAYPKPAKKKPAKKKPAKKPASLFSRLAKKAAKAAKKRSAAKVTKKRAAKIAKVAKKHSTKAAKHTRAAQKHTKAAKKREPTIEQAIARGIDEGIAIARQVRSKAKRHKHKHKAAQHAQAAEQHQQRAEHAQAQAVTGTGTKDNTAILLAAIWYFTRGRAA